MKTILLSILCLSLASLNVYSQTEPARTAQDAAIEREFDEAVNLHVGEFSRVVGARAALPPTDARIFSFEKNLPRLSAAAIAKLLREKFPQRTAILFYNYEEHNGLRAWVVDSQGIAGFSRLNADLPQIQRTIGALRDSLGIKDGQKGRAPERREPENGPSEPDRAAGHHAHQPRPNTAEQAVANLTSLLLPPNISRALGQTENLIVVPVLEIGLVPFAVLQPFGTKDMLVDHMSVSFAPSLFDLAAEKPEPWSANFSQPLIVGNPIYTQKSDWIIHPLPGSEKEAIAVAQMLHAKPLIGPEATKKAVLEKVVDADLLYFATHGVADNHHARNNSFIVFGPSGNDFGFWTMAEILNDHQKWGIIAGKQPKVPLKARLAVLSACQSGNGEAWKGGVLSLGRSMQASGIPRVVMSLWNVNDEATNSLMQSFVSYLQRDLPSEALRKAMLETRGKYPSPAHWASFGYFGLPD
jgi:CHAT domain-containing protein